MKTSRSTSSDHGTRGKRPRLRVGDRVSLSAHMHVIPAYGGKPFVGRDSVLRVSSVTGKGSLRNPWGISATDDAGNFWNLLPDDLVLADEAPRAHSTIRGGGESFASVHGKAVRENLHTELGRHLAEIKHATHVADYHKKIHAYGTETEMHRFAEGLRGVVVRPITDRERKELSLRKRQAFGNPQLGSGGRSHATIKSDKAIDSVHTLKLNDGRVITTTWHDTRAQANARIKGTKGRDPSKDRVLPGGAIGSFRAITWSY